MFNNVLDSILESSSFAGEEMTSSKYTPDASGVAVIMKESFEEIALIESEHAVGFAKKYVQAVQSSSSEADLREAVQDIQEASIGDMAAKIKEFFIKVKNKIKAVFDRFVMRLQQIWMSDKKFIKKYKSEIQTAASRIDDDFKIKVKVVSADVIGSEITSKLVAPLLKGIATPGKVTGANSDTDRKDIYKKITAAHLGKACDDASEVKDVLKDKLYENDGEAEEFVGELPSNYSVSNIITIMENGKFVKDVTKTKEEYRKLYDAVIKEFDDEIKKADKDENAVKEFTAKKNVALEANSISNIIIAENITATKTALSACRTIAGKLARYSTKQD